MCAMTLPPSSISDQALLTRARLSNGFGLRRPTRPKVPPHKPTLDMGSSPGSVFEISGTFLRKRLRKFPKLKPKWPSPEKILPPEWSASKREELPKISCRAVLTRTWPSPRKAPQLAVPPPTGIDLELRPSSGDARLFLKKWVGRVMETAIDILAYPEDPSFRRYAKKILLRRKVNARKSK